VGLANALIDLLLFWVLVAPLGILAANVVSTSAGMAFSLIANGRHTIGATRVTGQQALAFLATNALTMWFLQPLVIFAARDVAEVPLMMAKTLALEATVLTNFLLYRLRGLGRLDGIRSGGRGSVRWRGGRQRS
jgi:putative flippase GtrA